MEQPKAAGNLAVLFWECAELRDAWQQLKFQSGFHAVLLPSDDKAEFSHYAKFRTADGVSEGLNGSCGYAKVGPGHKQSILQPLMQ